jgi:hypothetical protein
MEKSDAFFLVQDEMQAAMAGAVMIQSSRVKVRKSRHEKRTYVSSTSCGDRKEPDLKVSVCWILDL